LQVPPLIFQARAKELDEYYSKTGETVGPLHGLPISLKNQCNVAGVEMNMDYVGLAGKVADKNSAIADVLEKQGAVLYVLTNMSQVGSGRHGLIPGAVFLGLG
jgi:amidase